MIIPEDLLFKYGAVVENYSVGKIIFREGDFCDKYYQIRDGIVQLSNSYPNGKEFVHGFPFSGHCFGESYLYNSKPFPISDVAVTKSLIIVLSKAAFLNLVNDYPYVLQSIIQYTADRLHFRYIICSFLAINDPLEKIQKLLDYIKNYFGYTELYSFRVPYTRLQIAHLSGMRVETIIRVIKKMHNLELLKINGGKIYS
jgi:CRP-like cAMP-binding protein